MNQKQKPSLEKKDIFWTVLNAAISLDIKKGPLKWSMTELSKTSKISRSLIYYYFGKSKENILLEAIHLFGKEFSGSTPERIEAWKRGEIAETLYQTQLVFKQSPFLRTFYTINREEKSKIGEAIRDYESKLRGKISQFFSALTKQELDAVFAMILGVAMTPGLSLETLQTAVRLILSGLKS